MLPVSTVIHARTCIGFRWSTTTLSLYLLPSLRLCATTNNTALTFRQCFRFTGVFVWQCAAIDTTLGGGGDWVLRRCEHIVNTAHLICSLMVRAMSLCALYELANFPSSRVSGIPQLRVSVGCSQKGVLNRTHGIYFTLYMVLVPVCLYCISRHTDEEHGVDDIMVVCLLCISAMRKTFAVNATATLLEYSII